jgi:hypothetical protein
MFAYTASSFGRLLTYWLPLPLILLTPVRSDSQPAALFRVSGSTLGARELRATGNPVIHWNAVATELMVDPGPIIDLRAFAILHLAIHDAVNSVERRFEPYTLTQRAPAGASLDAAVATAAHDVLVALSPSQREKIEREYTTALSAIPDGPAKTNGVNVGQRAAQANLARRAKDGIPVGPWPPQAGPITQPVYVPTGKPGDYAFTPPFDQPPLGPIALFPGFGSLTPFGSDLSRYRLPGPDALGSAAYARDLDSLKSLGSLHSRTRTADQSQTAFFWFEEFQVWNRLGRRVLEQKHVDPWQAARTLALTYLAAADAGIACFEAKYRFRFWRPFTAIRRADEDGNPATHSDKEWRPLLWPSSGEMPPTFFIPPIPEYPSAAAMISAAAAEVLALLLGDQQSLEATSPSLPGVTRRFSSFRQAAQENGMSRVFGGIHFLRAVRDGARFGQAIGRDVSQLLPPSH